MFADQSIISQGILRIIIGELVGLSFAKMPSLILRTYMMKLMKLMKRCHQKSTLSSGSGSYGVDGIISLWILWILWSLWSLWSLWIYQLGIPLITRNPTYNHGWTI